MNIVINPGSGSVEKGSRKQSLDNIRVFVADMGLSGIKIRFHSLQDDGRHTYILSRGKTSIDIDMPAIKLDKVRWIGRCGQDIWLFPRLYIGGSSWIWLIGIRVALGMFVPVHHEEWINKKERLVMMPMPTVSK